MRNRLIASLLIGQAGAAAVVLLNLFGWLQPLELLAHDYGVRLRAAPSVDERIVMVGVREEDLAELGWPLTDGQLAGILEALARAKPAAIGVDIYRDRPVGDGTAELDRVLRANPDIVWVNGFALRSASAIRAPAALEGTDRVGFSDLVVDPDGPIRRALLFLDAPGGAPATAFALLMAQRLLDRQGIAPEPAPGAPEHLRLGAATLAPLQATHGAYGGVDDRGYQIRMDYALGPNPTVGFTVRDALDGRIPAEALAGRLVFLAVMAETVKDHFRTPASGEFIHGAVVHGQITSQLLRMALGESPPPRTLSDPAEFAIVAGVGMTAPLAGLVLHGAAMFTAAFLGGAALLAALWYGAFLQQLWLPLAAPLLAWTAALGLTTAYLAWRERADREALMHLFASHVAEPVARSLWDQRDAFMDGGRPRPQRLTATVLFCDIGGFTTISERLTPEQLDEWLHEYMGAMVPVILGREGLVLRFVGDAILAIFGAPIPRGTEAEIDRDAAQAVRAGLAMARALTRVNEDWRRRGMPTASIRIGLHTGSMVAGSIGGPGHMEYSLTGDAVNTAARIEALAKEVGIDLAGGPCRMLVGEPTWQRLHGAFDGRTVGTFTLRGKDQTVGIYAILSDGPPPDADNGVVRLSAAAAGRKPPAVVPRTGKNQGGSSS